MTLRNVNHMTSICRWAIVPTRVAQSYSNEVKGPLSFIFSANPNGKCQICYLSKVRGCVFCVGVCVCVFFKRKKYYFIGQNREDDNLCFCSILQSVTFNSLVSLFLSLEVITDMTWCCVTLSASHAEGTPRISVMSHLW